MYFGQHFMLLGNILEWEMATHWKNAQSRHLVTLITVSLLISIIWAWVGRGQTIHRYSVTRFGIKSSPILITSGPKSSETVFSSKSWFLKEPKFCRIFGYFCKKYCSKIAQCGHTAYVWQDGHRIWLKIEIVFKIDLIGL